MSLMARLNVAHVRIAAMNATPQREYWDGHPVELGECLDAAQRWQGRACILVTHPLGWELRLMTSDLLRSQVCRSSQEILSTHEQWRAAMIEKGWR
jgi:hypothetical protein